MKKYFVIMYLCINSVFGGHNWSEEPGHAFSENTQRSVFPSITGQPRCTQTLRDPDFPCSTVQSSILPSWRGDQRQNAPKHPISSQFRFCPGKQNKLIGKTHQNTQYLLTQPQTPFSFHPKSPLPSHIYTEQKIEDDAPVSLFDMAQAFKKIHLDDIFSLNKKGDLFLEEEVVQIWNGDRQKGRDNKMDYLFSHDNAVYKE